jgi:uncharacterized protein
VTLPAGPRVTRLQRFPVKSCAAEPLQVVHVGVAGLSNDRWLGVVVDGRIVTQREFARLARVRPVLEDGSGRLTLTFEGLGPVECAVRTDGPAGTVTLFGEPVEVVDQGSEVGDWFSSVLGTSARLVAAPQTTRRTSPGLVTGQTVLSDEGTVSLHSEASLEHLNRVLARDGHPALPADRFRANIVIDGCEAHAEDRTERFDVGQVVLRFAQADARCVVTTIDQATGRRTGPEPLRSLAGYRRADSGGGVLFGIYTAVDVTGEIRLGDPVSLHGS